MNRKAAHHFRTGSGLALMLMLVAITASGQTRTVVGQNSTGCAADTVNPACRSGTSSNSSGNSPSSSYSNNAARTEAIANGVSTLIDIFSKSPERKEREAEARAEQARRQAEDARREAEWKALESRQQRDAEDLFASLGRNNSRSSGQNSAGASTGGNPWGEPSTMIKSSKAMDLERSQCLKVIQNKSGSAYIGHLSVQNACSEPIHYSFCYLSGGGDGWGDWECKQNAQGHFDRGSDVVGAGDTAVLPSSLSGTVVALAACAKPGLPFITSINQRQSGFTCQ